MSLPPSADLDSFWSEVLSGVPDRIRAVVEGLPGAERQSVIEHLKRMVFDEGWTEGQHRRARLALTALREG